MAPQFCGQLISFVCHLIYNYNYKCEAIYINAAACSFTWMKHAKVDCACNKTGERDKKRHYKPITKHETRHGAHEDDHRSTSTITREATHTERMRDARSDWILNTELLCLCVVLVGVV